MFRLYDTNHEFHGKFMLEVFASKKMADPYRLDDMILSIDLEMSIIS